MKQMKPPERLFNSEWADKYRYLSKEASSEPGRWKTSRVPYLKDVLDAPMEKGVQTIVFKASSQVGKSEFCLNIFGQHVHMDPCPILMIQPTLEMAESFSKERISPMIRDTPVLKERIKDKERNSENTILKKKFPGGFLALVGSNSPAAIASRPIRLLLCDEIDRYVPTKEGDAIKLGRARGTTFHNFLEVLVSTPTIKDASRIQNAYEAGDMRQYHVPCPHCGDYQILKWDNLEWDKSNTGEHLSHTAYYVCEHCRKKISHSKKRSMVKNGQWIAQKPTGKIASFEINALYSTFKSWEAIVDDFLDSKDDIEKYRVFVNTVLGDVFEEERSADALEIERDLRVEQYDIEHDVPEQVYVLTAGVDVQGDRLECEVVGWGVGEESWGIAYKVFWGSPSLRETWDMLDEFLNRDWTHKHGNLKIVCCLVDSGFSTNEVYSFTRTKGFRWIFASKGLGGRKEPISNPSRANKQRVVLYKIGVDHFKETLYQRLSLQAHGAGYCHFPDHDDYDQEYFDQLTAEEKVTKISKGVEISGWVKHRKRNEALDCRVYAHAALKIRNVDFKSMRRKRLQAIEEAKKDSAEKAPVKQKKRRFQKSFIKRY